MFDSAQERGVLVSGNSYTVDVSYVLWLPLVFLLGEMAYLTKYSFSQGLNHNRIPNVSGIFPVTFYSNLYAAMAFQLVTRILQSFRSVS